MKRIITMVAFCLLLSSITQVISEATHETPIYHEYNVGDKMLALTFDDGPHPVYTAEILDILGEYGIHATFFVIGKNAEQYPELMQREIAEGHEIGNHTYSHPHVAKIQSEQLINEILDTEEIILNITGSLPKLFRPPEGCYSDTIGKLIERLGYIPVIWSVDTLDWKRPSTESIINTVRQNVKSGDIILFHDYVAKSNTPAALRILIPELISQGYSFVTVTELMEAAQDSELPSQ